MPEARHGACRIRFAVDGPPDRPVLLLSNSLGTTLELWDSVVPILADRFRVVRYDTRGHGGSDAPGGPYSLVTLGEDALAVLDAAGVDRAAVGGISLGGLTALWLGRYAAPRVDRLIAANTGAKIGTLELWNERIALVRREGIGPLVEPVMSRWFTAEFRARDPATVARFAAMVAATPPDGYAGCCAAIRDADLRDELGQIRVPALIIVGSEDPATPPSLGQLLHDRLPDARLVSLTTAHLSNVEQPERFGAAVREFLDG
jgi:3-oxoadipate enol-lactonase